MDASVFEKYMKQTASAVLEVVESAEKFKGRTVDVEQAAILLALMYGDAPKTSAGNVASIVAASSSVTAQQKLLRDCDEKTGLAISAARYGIEHNQQRAESSATEICKIMEEIAPSALTALKLRLANTNKVHIGLNDDNTPRVDCSRYSIIASNNDATRNITAASFADTTVLDTVEKKLKDIFSKLDPQQQQPDSLIYVKNLANSHSMTAIVAWADAVEGVLRTADPALQRASSMCTDSPLVSRYASAITRAMIVIMEVVGKSYCKTVTQLSSAQDLDKFDKATETCYKALMADTHERLVCTVLFYVCFRPTQVNSKEYVKRMLGAMSGSSNTEPVAIERRSAADTLFGLCFMFKMLPSEFVDGILSFPSGGFSYHGLSGTSLGPLLSNYCPRFEEPWLLFKGLLAERTAMVRNVVINGGSIEAVDAGANLTGPVYVLISDAALAFQRQRFCTGRMLADVKEKYDLWDSYTRSTA